MKNLIRLSSFILIFLFLGYTACSDNRDPLRFLVGVWNPIEGIRALENEWADNEEAQPYRLECNGIFYSGWANFSMTVDTTYPEYLAVLGSFLCVEKMSYDSDIILLNISYTSTNSKEKQKAIIKIQVVSNDEIWFEPDYTDQDLLDYLSLSSFKYGPVHTYIRAPLWKDSTGSTSSQ